MFRAGDFTFKRTSENEAKELVREILERLLKYPRNSRMFKVLNGNINLLRTSFLENRLYDIIEYDDAFVGYYVKNKNNKLPEFIYLLNEQYARNNYEKIILESVIGTLKPGVHHIEFDMMNHPLMMDDDLLKIYKSVGFVPIVSPDEHTISLAVIIQ
jgi:hypothetical protein